jgi:hypothetical protein
MIQWRHRLARATSVAFVVLVGSRHAKAQGPEAEALFDEGSRLMAEGEIVKACEAFEAANQAKPSAGTLIGLGLCREKNQQLASAWSAYKEALSRVKDARKRDFATGRTTDLGARMSYVTVTVSDDSRLAGLTVMRNGKPFDALLWNRPLPVDGGDYVITAHAPGREDWTMTAHVAAEGAKVTVDVPKLQKSGKPPAPLPFSPPVVVMWKAPSPVAHPAPDAAPSAGLFTTRRKVALGVAGGSVLGVVAGVVLGESAKGKQHDAYGLCPDPGMQCAQAGRSDALIHSGHSRAIAADVAFGLGAVAAVGAGLLWFTGARVAEDGRRRVSVVPRVASGQAGLVVIGRF